MKKYNINKKDYKPAPTKYCVWDVVWVVDNDGIPYKFPIEKIRINFEPMYSGSGGCGGFTQRVEYYDNDNGTWYPCHRVYKNAKDANVESERIKKMRKDYRYETYQKLKEEFEPKKGDN